jgi:hypothetical protein
MLSREVFIITLWGLLMSTIFAPIMFKKVLWDQINAQSSGDKVAELEEFTLTVHGSVDLQDVCEVIHEQGMAITRLSIEHGVFIFIVEADEDVHVDDETIGLVKHGIEDAISDKNGHVAFEKMIKHKPRRPRWLSADGVIDNAGDAAGGAAASGQQQPVAANKLEAGLTRGRYTPFHTPPYKPQNIRSLSRLISYRLHSK